MFQLSVTTFLRTLQISTENVVSVPTSLLIYSDYLILDFEDRWDETRRVFERGFIGLCSLCGILYYLTSLTYLSRDNVAVFCKLLQSLHV